jgi:DNA-binding GntR family transcriptional regulator
MAGEVTIGQAPRERQTAGGAEGGARTARERAYDFVRESILLGRFPAGEFIEEETVCAATGLSRTPVREAFGRLGAERYIDLMPRRGALVRGVSADELIQIYETRRLLEGFAIDHICGAGRGAPPTMRALCDRMRATPAEDLLGHVELDQAYHRALVSGTGNEILAELYAGMRARQMRVAMTALGADPSRIGQINDEHEAIVAALDRADAEDARAVLARHLRPLAHVVSRLVGGATVEG